MPLRKSSSSPYSFVRGRVKNLEGNVDSPYFSWARFDLEYEHILLHHPFVLLPPIEEGDEVVVAGAWNRNSFRPLACAKPNETEDERHQRSLREKSRQQLWFGLACLPGVVLMLLAVLVDRSLYPLVLMGAFPIFMAQAAFWEVEMAKKEMELAIARGDEIDTFGS